MALTLHEARRLRKGDRLYTRYSKPNGQIGVSGWDVLHNSVSSKPDLKNVVDVKLICGRMSGRLVNNNLSEFYLTYSEAREGKK